MNTEVGAEKQCFLCKYFFDQPSFAKENFKLLNGELYIYSKELHYVEYASQISEIQNEFPMHLQKSRSYSNLLTTNSLLTATDPNLSLHNQKCKVYVNK